MTTRGLTSPRYLASIGLRAGRARGRIRELLETIDQRGAGADWPVETLEAVETFLRGIEDYAAEGVELMRGGDYRELGVWTRNGPRLRVGSTVLQEPGPCQDSPGDGAPGG